MLEDSAAMVTGPCQGVSGRRAMFSLLPIEILDAIADALIPPSLSVCSPYFHPYCSTCDPSSDLVPLTRLCRGLTGWAETRLYRGFVGPSCDLESIEDRGEVDDAEGNDSGWDDDGDSQDRGGHKESEIFMDTLARRADLRRYVKKLDLSGANESEASLATLCPRLESLRAPTAVAAVCAPLTLRDLVISKPGRFDEGVVSSSLLARLIADLPDLRSLEFVVNWPAEEEDPALRRILKSRNLACLGLEYDVSVSDPLELASSIQSLTFLRLDIRNATPLIRSVSAPSSFCSLTELVILFDEAVRQRFTIEFYQCSGLKNLQQLTFRVSHVRTIERHVGVPLLPTSSTCLPSIQRIIFSFSRYVQLRMETLPCPVFLNRLLVALRKQRDRPQSVKHVIMHLYFHRWGGLEKLVELCKNEAAYSQWRFEPVEGYKRGGGIITDESIVLKYPPTALPESLELRDGRDMEALIVKPAVIDDTTTPTWQSNGPSRSLGAGISACLPLIAKRLAFLLDRPCHNEDSVSHPLCAPCWNYTDIQNLLYVCSDFRRYFEPLAYHTLELARHNAGGIYQTTCSSALHRTLQERPDLAACVEKLTITGACTRDSAILALCPRVTYLRCDNIALALCPAPNLRHLRIDSPVSSSQLSELLVRHPNLESLLIESCSPHRPSLPLAVQASRMKLSRFEVRSGRYKGLISERSGPLPPALCQATSLVEVKLPFRSGYTIPCWAGFMLAHTAPLGRVQTLTLTESDPCPAGCETAPAFPDVDWALLRQVPTLKRLRVEWATRCHGATQYFPPIPPGFTVSNGQEWDLSMGATARSGVGFGGGFIASLISWLKTLYQDSLMAIDLSESLLDSEVAGQLQSVLDGLGAVLVTDSSASEMHHCYLRRRPRG